MFARSAALFTTMLMFATFPAQAEKDKAKELFEDVCTSCHTLSRVKSQELTKEEWQGRIKGMISEGAALTDEEFSMIVDYLAKNFGKKEEQ